MRSQIRCVGPIARFSGGKVAGLRGAKGFHFAQTARRGRGRLSYDV